MYWLPKAMAKKFNDHPPAGRKQSGSGTPPPLTARLPPFIFPSLFPCNSLCDSFLNIFFDTRIFAFSDAHFSKAKLFKSFRVKRGWVSGRQCLNCFETTTMENSGQTKESAGQGTGPGLCYGWRRRSKFNLWSWPDNQEPGVAVISAKLGKPRLLLSCLMWQKARQTKAAPFQKKSMTIR